MGTISTDPIGFSAGDANLYRYVGNHGTYASDPSGLDEYADQVRTSLSAFRLFLHSILPFGSKDAGAEAGAGAVSLYLHTTGSGYGGNESEGANKAFALSYAGKSSLPAMIAPSPYRATVVPSFQSYASGLAVETNELGATYGEFSTPLIDNVAQEAAMALLPLKGAGSLNKTALRLEKNLLRKLDSLEHVADAVPSARQVDNTFSHLSDWARARGVSGDRQTGTSINNDFSKLFDWSRTRAAAPRPTARVVPSQVNGGRFNVEVPPARPTGSGVVADAHNANVRLLGADGKSITVWREVSGNATASEKALGTALMRQATHTEQRALTRINLTNEGLVITGQRAPCNSCQGALRAATSGNQARIQYQWLEKVGDRWVVQREVWEGGKKVLRRQKF